MTDQSVNPFDLISPVDHSVPETGLGQANSANRGRNRHRGKQGDMGQKVHSLGIAPTTSGRRLRIAGRRHGGQ